MLLEVCANSYQSAINAQKAGAHRIELCQELRLGGLTPTIETFKKVRQELTIPIYVLVRPRAGNFVYSDEEFKLLLNQIETFKKLGADGIVCGGLKEDNSINLKQTKQIIETSRPLSFTFHRAFDEVNDSFESLEILESLGADRVLTSGQQSTAEKGIELLIELNKRVKHIKILPGAGINHTNASLFMQNNFEEIHASCSVKNSFSKQPATISGVESIQMLLKVLNS